MPIGEWDVDQTTIGAYIPVTCAFDWTLSSNQSLTQATDKQSPLWSTSQNGLRFCFI